MWIGLGRRCAFRDVVPQNTVREGEVRSWSEGEMAHHHGVWLSSGLVQDHNVSEICISARFHQLIDSVAASVH